MNANLPINRDLFERTKQLAVRVVRLYVALPKTSEAQVLGKQVLRSGTSVGAHYHEARRARSLAEFISKLEGGLQELDETGYWLDLLVRCEIMPEKRVGALRKEVEELTAWLTSSVRTLKKKNSRAKLAS